MLKKLLPIICCVSIFIPSIAIADTITCSPDFMGDSVTCQTKPDPFSEELKQVQQNLRDEELKQQRLLEQGEQLRQNALNSIQQHNDKMNQITQQALQQEQALEQHQQDQRQQLQAICSAADKLLINGQCVSRDSLCQQKYGTNWMFQSMDKDGKMVCGCKPGWAYSQGSCVLASAKQQNINFNQTVQPQVAGTQTLVPIQSVPDKPSLFRRMLNWFKGLF